MGVFMERIEIIIFWLAVVTCGVSSIIYVKNFISKTENVLYSKIATIFGIISFISLTSVIAISWVRTGLHPFTGPFTTTLFYAVSVLGLFLLVEYFYLKKAEKLKLLGLFVMPFAVVLMLKAWQTYKFNELISPELKSFRVFIHISSALFAYGAFTMATFLAILYLFKERQLKSKSTSSIWKKFPSLETSDVLCYRTIAIGFVFSVILLLTGMITAQMVWGHMWDWGEPRMVSALVMTLIYGFYLYSREIMGWRGKRSSIIAIIGFIAALITYFAPYLMESIHRWGTGF